MTDTGQRGSDRPGAPPDAFVIASIAAIVATFLFVGLVTQRTPALRAIV